MIAKRVLSDTYKEIWVRFEIDTQGDRVKGSRSGRPMIQRVYLISLLVFLSSAAAQVQNYVPVTGWFGLGA